MKRWIAAISLGVMAGFSATAVADDEGGGNKRQRVFRAQLVGYNENPAVSTPARGQFYAVVNAAETEIRYWLRYTNLSADTTQSHIHLGQHHTNGGIIVWLCEGTSTAPTDATPACAPDTTIQGVITSLEIIGPPAQGIAPTEFAELLAAMRAGAAYANVHSATFLGGEIRGQIH